MEVMYLKQIDNYIVVEENLYSKVEYIMKKNKYRIFLGVQEIAGMMERLYNAFKEKDITCDFYCMYDYDFSTAGIPQHTPQILKRYRKHTNKIRSTDNRNIKRFWYLFQMVDIIVILFYSLIHYDQYIYIFGHGMFLYNCYLKHIQQLEFWILRLFKKNIIIWCCGSDTRAPYCDCDIYNGNIEKMWEDTKQKCKKVQMLEKYGTLIDSQASSHFHTKPYIVYSSIGIPVDENEKVEKKNHENEKVTILHAPSNQKYKGTHIVRKIIEELIEEGYSIEYIEVSGETHDTVLEKVALADMVVDQVFSDTPMPGLATESSLNGIPVIIAGYYAELYKNVYSNPIPPTVYCMPEELKENIINLINNRDKRVSIGEGQKRFVEENWMSDKVAERFCRIFDGDIPKEWIFDPKDNSYIFGGGLEKEEVIRNVVLLIEKYGENALCLIKEGVLFSEYKKVYLQYKDKVYK